MLPALRPMAASFCSRCGEALEGHARCDRAGRPGTRLDPPRFCGDCGAKLTIQVEPAGYGVRCLRCERRPRLAHA